MDEQNSNLCTILPDNIINKLNDEEKKYISQATYISKWINLLDFEDYIHWANEDDINIIKKIHS